MNEVQINALHFYEKNKKCRKSKKNPSKSEKNSTKEIKRNKKK